MRTNSSVPFLMFIVIAGILRQHLPELKIRVVNVVDLMKLQPSTEHPHGLTIRSSPRTNTSSSHFMGIRG
jgi:xylulose-5-phosphate/fructose-6-phosphate phosphoketolase